MIKQAYQQGYTDALSILGVGMEKDAGIRDWFARLLGKFRRKPAVPTSVPGKAAPAPPPKVGDPGYTVEELRAYRPVNSSPTAAAPVGGKAAPASATAPEQIGHQGPAVAGTGPEIQNPPGGMLSPFVTNAALLGGGIGGGYLLWGNKAPTPQMYPQYGPPTGYNGLPY